MLPPDRPDLPDPGEAPAPPSATSPADGALPDDPATPAGRQPREHHLLARIRHRITAGLVLVLPIYITAFLVMAVFRLMRDASLWALKFVLASPLGDDLLRVWEVTSTQLLVEGWDVLPWRVRWSIGVFAVILTILVLYILGAVTSNIFGRRMVHLLEALVDRLPIVKSVYRASKQVLETFTGDTTRAFQKVVVVPFPSDKIRSIGFVTRSFSDSVTGEAYYAVFVPTTPNPTSGFALVVRTCDVVESPMSTEDALKVIMSGGILMPEQVAVGPR